MLIVLSPAKTLDYASLPPKVKASEPRLNEHSSALIERLREFDADGLSRLMGISSKIAALNVARNQAWRPKADNANSRPAVFAFRGDVYSGLQADTMTEDTLKNAQQRLRILSGLYGLLRPLDRMQPYRLEMGTALPTVAGRNLYAWWGDTITDLLAADLRAANLDTLLNLASQEYFRAVNRKRLNARVISPVFEDEKAGRFKVISFYAKKARGLMARWVLEHQVTDAARLSDFAEAGYHFAAADSDAERLVFRRREKDR